MLYAVSFDNLLINKAHFFPYTGRLYLFETEAEQSEVEKYINSDPYIKNRKIGKIILFLCFILL